MVYYNTKNNTGSWEVFSNHTVYWKNYGDTITQNFIKNLNIVSDFSSDYPYLKSSDSNITFFTVTKDYIWQKEVNSIRNILITWKYKDTWFFCIWMEVLNDNNQKVYDNLKCNKGYSLIITNKLKNNVYNAYFNYENIYLKWFDIIMWATNKTNNF